MRFGWSCDQNWDFRTSGIRLIIPLTDNYGYCKAFDASFTRNPHSNTPALALAPLPGSSNARPSHRTHARARARLTPVHGVAHPLALPCGRPRRPRWQAQFRRVGFAERPRPRLLPATAQRPRAVGNTMSVLHQPAGDRGVQGTATSAFNLNLGLHRSAPLFRQRRCHIACDLCRTARRFVLIGAVGTSGDAIGTHCRPTSAGCSTTPTSTPGSRSNTSQRSSAGRPATSSTACRQPGPPRSRRTSRPN